jgi:hypothetical protein
VFALFEQPESAAPLASAVDASIATSRAIDVPKFMTTHKLAPQGLVFFQVSFSVAVLSCCYYSPYLLLVGGMGRDGRRNV